MQSLGCFFFHHLALFGNAHTSVADNSMDTYKKYGKYLHISKFSCFLARVISQAFFIFWGEMEAEQDKVIYLKLLLKCIKLEWRVTVIQCNKVINLYSVQSTWCVFNPLESIDNSTVSCSLIRDWSWQCMLQTNPCHHSKQPLNTHIPIYFHSYCICTHFSINAI